MRLPTTGGFGSHASDWQHQTLSTGRKPVALALTKGQHTVRMENVDGNGLNLDYLALVPIE